MPPVHDRLPAAQSIRGLPAMEKVAGGWLVPPDRVPGGAGDLVAQVADPGRPAPTDRRTPVP